MLLGFLGLMLCRLTVIYCHWIIRRNIYFHYDHMGTNLESHASLQVIACLTRIPSCELYCVPAIAPREWTSSNYCRMLLTRHYDQRPFDEIVCDAIIANGGVKELSKRCKAFAMTDESNTVQILVACAMKGIRFSSINCL